MLNIVGVLVVTLATITWGNALFKIDKFDYFSGELLKATLISELCMYFSVFSARFTLYAYYDTHARNFLII